MNTNNDLHIVVIGSSAGGLEALSALFEKIKRKDNNIAYVVAQHSSPDYESHLAELLAKKTALDVKPATNKLVLKAGMVAVVPPGYNCLVKKNHLDLKSSDTVYHPSIDILFASAASAFKEHAIGIILSGAGNDGAIGVEQIKKNGGYTLVQNPDEAKYNGMPKAALATHSIDKILLASEVYDAVKYCVRKVSMRKSKPVTIKNNEKNTHEKILDLLAEHIGVDFSNYKSSTILRRINRRIQLLNIATAEKYFSYVFNHPEELNTLYYDLLIGVTQFFRDKEIFKYLTKKLTELSQKKQKGETIRVWIPACATGEEAYSIAIILTEILGLKIKDTPVQILATDIDEKALKIARKGVYAETQLVQLDKKIFQKYFIHTGNGFEVVKPIRSMVLFSRHDLISSPPFIKVDLISCRNLLIYFNKNLQNQIIPMFHYALNNDGLLLLGKSESVGIFSNLFHASHIKYKLYIKKPDVKQRSSKIKHLITAEKTVAVNSTHELSLEDVLKENIFEQFDCPFAVVNDKMDIIRIQGEVFPYLSIKQGKVSLNVLKNAHPKIQIELRALLAKCIESGKKVDGKIKLLKITDSETFIRLRVSPLLNQEQKHQLYLIVFELFSSDDFTVLTKTKTTTETDNSDNFRIIELENELNEAKEHLQSFVEELETTNEELQSLNEELQSTNEELQASNEELETSNEELQSAYEEMIIAYNELREVHRILEQKDVELNSSLERVKILLENSTQAYLLINSKYGIELFNSLAEHFTQKATQKILRKGDTILNYALNETRNSLKKVMQNAFSGQLVQLDRSLQIDGKETFLRIQYIPVKGQKTKVDYVLISYVDLTDEIKTQQKIQDNEANLRAIIQHAEGIIWSIDTNGKLLAFNNRFIDSYTLITGDEPVKGIDFFDFLRKDTSNDWVSLYKRAVEEGNVVFENKREVAGQPRYYRTSINAIVTENNEVKGLSCFSLDLTENKLAEQKILENDASLDAIINSTTDIIWSVNKEYKLSAANKAYIKRIYDMTGQTVNIGYPILVKDYPEEINKEWESYYKRAFSGERFTIEVVYTINEKPLYSEVSFNPIKLYNEIIEVGCFSRDITERRQAERDMNLLMSNTEESFVLIDKVLNIISFNKEFKEKYYLYFNKEVKKGDSILDYAQPDRKNLLADLYNTVLTGETIISEIELPTHDYGTLIYSNTYKPAYDTDGKIIGAFVTSTDVTEKKIADRKILESEKKYRHLFEQNPMPMWVIDKTNFSFLDVNDAAIRHYGYSREEFLSMRAVDIRPEEDKKKFTELSRKNTLTFAGVWRHLKKDGSLIYVETRANELVFNDKNARLILANDITERIKAEDELKKLSLIAKETMNIAIITDTEERIQWVNDTFTRITEYTLDEVIGKRPSEFLQGEETDIATKQYMREHLNRKESFECEVVNYSKSGRRYILKIQCQPITDNNGEVTHFFAIETDITETKQAEKLLIKSENNLRSVFDNTDTAYLLLDNKANILSFNRNAKTLALEQMGRSLSENLNYIDLMHADRKYEVRKAITSVLRYGKKIAYEIIYTNPGRPDKWLYISMHPVLNENKQVLGLSIAATDITDRKLSEMERDKISSDLIRHNKDLEQFAYIVSHNLRAPVANITGLATILNDYSLLSDEEKEETIQGLTFSATKLDNVILDLNHILQVKREISENKEVVHFSSLVNDIKASIKQLIEKENVSIHTDFTKTDKMLTLKSYLYSIFYNLISNAIKYRQPFIPLVITIKSERVKNKVILIFSDNGSGIDLKSKGDQVFGLYKRFHSRVEGKGIGLFMVKTQVEALGGIITLTSEINKGTEFKIEFTI